MYFSSDLIKLNHRYKQRNIFEISLNQIKEKLYSPFSDWFETKRNAVWFQINRKMVNIIWFHFDLVRFRKVFSVCILLGTYSSNVLCLPCAPQHTLSVYCKLEILQHTLSLYTAWLKYLCMLSQSFVSKYLMILTFCFLIQWHNFWSYSSLTHHCELS